MTQKNKSISPLLKRAVDAKNASTNIINLLDIGNDALLTRIHLIRSAQKTIDIQTFIWKKDDVGIKVLKELYDAAKRGVKVRLLIDFWIFNEHNEVIDFLNVNHRNFEVKLYNPPLDRLHADFLSILGKTIIDFKGVNQRMHNKTFIIDNALAIIGGRNYDNMYYDRGETRNFIDLDLMMCGPVVTKIIKSFNIFWRHKLSISCTHFKDIKSTNLRKCAELLEKEAAKISKDIFKQLDAEADDHGLFEDKFLKNCFKSKDVDFVYDQPGKISKDNKQKLSKTALRLQRMLARAQTSIYVQSPYFVLSRKVLHLIKRLKKEQPNLDMVVSTNSLAATDNIYAYAMLHKEKKIYIKDLKIRVFELKPIPEDFPDLVERDLLTKNVKKKKNVFSFFTDDDTIARESKFLCIHAKVFVVNSDLVWVGSYNADIRSEMINTEIAVVIEDKKIAEAIKDKIKRICSPQNSWTVAPKKYIPVVTEFNDELTSLSNALPIVDLWPFRNVTCYEIKDNAKPTSIFNEDFYDRYESAGPFPQITTNLKEKEIKIRLLKTFGKIIKPIV